MRTVLVLPDAPLPTGSAAGRWYYHLAATLPTLTETLDVFYIYDSEAQAAQVRELLGDGPNISGFVRGTAKSKLASAREPYRYHFSDAMTSALENRLLEPYDVLHLEQLWTGWIGLAHKARSLLNVHYLFCIDLKRAPYSSFKDRLLRQRSLQSEKELLRSFPFLTTVTGRLEKEVATIAPVASVQTLPFAFDVARYEPKTAATGESLTVGLVGSFNWFPTLSAARRLVSNIWPHIKKAVPEARLSLIGRSANDFQLPADSSDIQIFADVDDIEEFFKTLDVMVYAPDDSSGIKVKVLEAMAWGVPVVGNGAAFEGLSVTDGENVGLSETDEGLCSRAVKVLTDRNHARSIREEARRLVDEHYATNGTLTTLLTMYESIRDTAG